MSLESKHKVSCDECGETWFWEDHRGHRPFCPGCNEIWHKVGQTFTGYVFTVRR